MSKQLMCQHPLVNRNNKCVDNPDVVRKGVACNKEYSTLKYDDGFWKCVAIPDKKPPMVCKAGTMVGINNNKEWGCVANPKMPPPGLVCSKSDIKKVHKNEWKCVNDPKKPPALQCSKSAPFKKFNTDTEMWGCVK